MDSSTHRILIAEDNPALLRVTQFTIERAGFSVTTAVNGQLALEKLQSESFDLLISDQQMPRMTGIELISAARELPSCAHMPIILLTAKALELSHDQLARELGVAKVLGKPFSPVEISRLVQDLLPTPV